MQSATARPVSPHHAVSPVALGTNPAVELVNVTRRFAEVMNVRPDFRGLAAVEDALAYFPPKARIILDD